MLKHKAVISLVWNARQRFVSRFMTEMKQGIPPLFNLNAEVSSVYLMTEEGEIENIYEFQRKYREACPLTGAHYLDYYISNYWNIFENKNKLYYMAAYIGDRDLFDFIVQHREFGLDYTYNISVFNDLDDHKRGNRNIPGCLAIFSARGGHLDQLKKIENIKGRAYLSQLPNLMIESFGSNSLELVRYLVEEIQTEPYRFVFSDINIIYPSFVPILESDNIELVSYIVDHNLLPDEVYDVIFDNFLTVMLTHNSIESIRCLVPRFYTKIDYDRVFVEELWSGLNFPFLKFFLSEARYAIPVDVYKKYCHLISDLDFIKYLYQAEVMTRYKQETRAQKLLNYIFSNKDRCYDHPFIDYLLNGIPEKSLRASLICFE